MNNWILSCFSILFFIHDLMNLLLSSWRKLFFSLHKDLTFNSNLTFITQVSSQLLIPGSTPPPIPQALKVSFMRIISLVLLMIFMDCRGKTTPTADFSFSLHPCYLIMYQLPQYNPRFCGYFAWSLSIQECYRGKYYSMKDAFFVFVDWSITEPLLVLMGVLQVKSTFFYWILIIPGLCFFFY